MPPYNPLLQRVPRGESFEEEDYKGACGLASNGGWIKLTDKCLVIEQDIDQGHFYPSIVHEMSHQIDYEEGKRLYKASHRSQQQDYLKLSGFYLHEYKDGNGHIHRDWKRKKAPHLTDYADSSPQENFAEVMAWFRMDGDIAAKKMTKDHNDFISGNYYGNRKFTKKWIISAWMDSYASELDQESTRAFINCSGKTNCLAGKIGEIEGEVRAKILIKEAEGCKVLADQIALAYWRKEAEARVKKMLEAHQKSFSTDKNYLARLQGLSDTQSGPGIAAGAFIECSDSDREQECYLEEINRKIEDEKLALTYLSFYPWESISKRSMDAYRTLIMGKQQDLRTRVKKLWKGCLIDPNDTEVPSGDIFLLSEGYMISSLYNCINAHSSEVIKDFVREFHVQHGKEEALLIHETRVSLVKLLKEIYEKENAKEAKGCAPALPLYHLKKELINPACSPPKTRP